MAAQAAIDERRLELCENEMDNTQKSNCEAYYAHKTRSDIKSNESKEEHNEANIGSGSQRIVSNDNKSAYGALDIENSRETNENSLSIEVLPERKQKRHGPKQGVTIERLLGLKQSAEWSNAEDGDILQQAVSLSSKKIEKGRKPTNTKHVLTKPRQEAAIQPDPYNSANEPIEEVSTGITVRQPIAPVVSIEGDEIVLRIPIQVKKCATQLERQLRQRGKEANYKRDTIKKPISRQNRISRIKNHKSSNCFTSDGGGTLMCKGVPHKKHSRNHEKGVRVKRSKHKRRSKSAPYKSSAAVNKGQRYENHVHSRRHLSSHRKILSASAESLNSIPRRHSCECDDESFVGGRGSSSMRNHPRRYLLLGKDQRFKCVQHPTSKVRIPIKVVPRKSTRKGSHLSHIRSNNKRAVR